MENDKYFYDIKKVLNEIVYCYKNKCYFAAISLSLILPDVCSKYEYDVKRFKTDGYYYKKWCKEWLSEYFISDNKFKQTDDLWAEALYKARCGILHNVEYVHKQTGNDYIDLKGFNFYINDNVDSFHQDALSIEGETFTGLCRQWGKDNFTININVGYFVDMILNGVQKFIIEKDIKVEDMPVLKIYDK